LWGWMQRPNRSCLCSVATTRPTCKSQRYAYGRWSKRFSTLKFDTGHLLLAETFRDDPPVAVEAMPQQQSYRSTSPSASSSTFRIVAGSTGRSSNCRIRCVGPVLSRRSGSGCQRARFSTCRPETLRNSRPLFETSVTFRATACEAMSVSSGPIGAPDRSSFARTCAYAIASSNVNSTTASGRRKFSTSRSVLIGDELGATHLTARSKGGGWGGQWSHLGALNQKPQRDRYLSEENGKGDARDHILVLR
jgi:hypothetical protein